MKRIDHIANLANLYPRMQDCKNYEDAETIKAAAQEFAALVHQRDALLECQTEGNYLGIDTPTLLNKVADHLVKVCKEDAYVGHAHSLRVLAEQGRAAIALCRIGNT